MTDKSQNLIQIVLILMKSTNLSSFPNKFHFLFITILENRFVPRELDAMTFKKPQKCGIFCSSECPIIFIKSHSCPESRKILELSVYLGILKPENNVKGHCRLKSGHFVGHLNRSKSRIQSHGNEFVNFRVDEG